jgi:mRNA-degrading endonuclease toxin of MazEF toxin-antitoxin module
MSSGKMTDKYAQGTVWKCAGKKAAPRSKTQDGGAVLLVVSNTDFNRSSAVVNCAAITSAGKDSAANVQVFLEKEANICCEQINTINKNELVEFIGIVSDAVLSEVKAKLKTQFNCDNETPMSLLLEIRNSLKQTNDNLPAPKPVSKPAPKKETEAEKKTAVKQETSLPEATERKRKGKYSDEDIDFILNKENSPDVVMEKYGIKNKQGVHELRYRFRKRVKPAKVVTRKRKAAAKPSRKKYSADDIAFLLDTSNSTESVMQRFGLKSKNSVYSLRYTYGKKEKQSTES